MPGFKNFKERGVFGKSDYKQIFFKRFFVHLFLYGHLTDKHLEAEKYSQKLGKYTSKSVTKVSISNRLSQTCYGILRTGDGSLVLKNDMKQLQGI